MVKVAAATTLTRNVFPNLLDLSWLQPPKYLNLYHHLVLPLPLQGSDSLPLMAARKHQKIC
jgi:hypothetical protein